MSCTRPRTVAIVAALMLGAMTAAAQAIAIVSVSVASGSPVVFVPTNITNPSFPANGPMTLNLTLVSLLGGGGHVAIAAPASIVAADGVSLSPALITATCTRGTVGSAFVSTGVVTLVPGGTSADCATVGANQSLLGTFIVTMFINDRTIPADSWTSAGFSVVATSS